jgi:Immunity protein 74
MKWLSRGTFQVDINGRSVTGQGEPLVSEHGRPTYLVYSDTLVKWEDGGAVSDAERAAILHRIQEEAERGNWRAEME